MRAIAIAVLVLMGVLGLAIPPAWNQVASAEERTGGSGMRGPKMTPEMMRGMGMVGPEFHGRRAYKRPLISLMLMWKDRLRLNTDQERTLREFRANFGKESIKRIAEIDVAELELNDLLVERGKVNIAKVETLVKKIAIWQAELRVARIKTIEAGKAVLTPEQTEKLERLIHRSMMGGGMGIRMMGHDMAPMRQGCAVTRAMNIA